MRKCLWGFLVAVGIMLTVTTVSAEDGRHTAIHAEAGGPTLLTALVFESQGDSFYVSGRLSPFGAGIGGGWLIGRDEGAVHDHMMDLGFGVAALTDWSSLVLPLPGVHLAWRYQHRDGFTFRAGVAPTLVPVYNPFGSGGLAVAPLPMLSGGWTF